MTVFFLIIIIEIQFYYHTFLHVRDKKKKKISAAQKYLYEFKKSFKRFKKKFNGVSRKVNNDNLNLERKSPILRFCRKKKYIITLKYCHYRNIFSMLI